MVHDRNVSQARPSGWRSALPLGLSLVLAACDPIAGSLGTRANLGFDDERASTTATASYLTGQLALQEGDIDEAAIRLNEALAADPTNVVLRRQVFFLDVSSGRISQALAHAAELVELEPAMQEPHLLLGLHAASEGRFDDALDRLDRIEERGVIGLAIPLMRAWSHYGSGDRDSALALLDEQASQEGLELLIAYHRGLVMLFSGETAAASEILNGSITDDIDPIRVVAAAAEANRANGDLEAARTIIAEELERLPGDVVLEAARADLASGEPLELQTTGTTSAMADGLLGLARAVERRRSDPRGVLLGQMAAMLDPDAGDIQLFLARSFLSQDRSDAAIETLKGLKPGTPWTWEGRLVQAEALFRDDRADEAVALLGQMAVERPERTDALVAMGDLERRRENYRAGEQAYSQAFERIDQLTAGHWRLLYSRAITYERTGRWDLAERDFLNALELFPDQPLVLNYLGYSWVDQNLHLERAEQMLITAVELRPNDGFIVDSLGWAYYRLGRFDEAVDYLERAVELQPGDPVINDHLGDAYWRAGRLREARYQWERALTFGAEPDIVADIERKLQFGLPEVENSRG